MTGAAPVLDALVALRGQGLSYNSRKGVYCPTNAIYWLKECNKSSSNTIIITNLADSGKKSVSQVTIAVEPTFVHDLVRGRDVGRWTWDSKLKVILPQDPKQPAKAVPEAALKTKHPKTFGYFEKFEKEIRDCALLAQFFDPELDPFYSSYNVGHYTYAKFKVVWKEISNEIEATVIESNGTTIIPDHKLVLVAFDKAEPAYFLSGILNSSPVGLFIRSYGVQTSISGHIFEYMNIPSYSRSDLIHKEVVDIARQCHTARDAQLANLEERLDLAVAKALSIPAKHSKVMRKELRVLRDG